MKTDTSEKGLESLIMRHMTGTDGLNSGREDSVAEVAKTKGGTGWKAGNDAAFDREFAVDTEQLFSFMLATQPEEWAKLGIANYKDKEGMARQKFLAQLQGEINRRGTIDVLRHGLKHGPLGFDLFYGKPSAQNTKAMERHAMNRFTITRQLHFSRENRRSLDLCAFINGLPVITFELKNSLTKQTVEDAVEQYKRDRDPREPLFQFGRCIVHFAVDDHAVAMCTDLKGKAGTAKDSWFLPFNQGCNDGAGNPPNSDGLKTDYLWKQILTPERLTEIIENYAQIVEEIHPKTGRKKKGADISPLPSIGRGADAPRGCDGVRCRQALPDPAQRGQRDGAWDRAWRMPRRGIPPLPVLCFLVRFVARTESVGVGVGEAFTSATSRPT